MLQAFLSALTTSKRKLQMATSDSTTKQNNSHAKRVKCYCLYCSKEFFAKQSVLDSGHGKYCSRQCNTNSQKILVEYTCETCGLPFFRRPSYATQSKHKYCSSECNPRKPNGEYSCKECGKKFKSAKSNIARGFGKYCSVACGAIARRRRVECVCEICGCKFEALQKRVEKGGAKYCSKKCMGVGARDNYIVSCSNCEKSFKTTKYKYVNREKFFCSRACFRQYAPPIERNCLSCGKSILVQQYKVKRNQGLYCSKACYGLSERAENNYKWKGGGKVYYGENWVTQRKLTRERDGGICQICHRKPNRGERRFAVHHIKPFRSFNGDWESANQLSNLIVLCDQCHPKAENGLIPVPLPLL